VLVLKRIGDSHLAVLAARLVTGGNIRIVSAPSNQHNWVLDGNKILPLPSDVQVFVERLVGYAVSQEITLVKAVELARRTDAELLIEVDPSLLGASPPQVANEDPTEIAGLSGTLFPYQSQGVRWMRSILKRAFGLVLADEMGLGKTIQVISLLLLEKPKPEAPALVLCPTSLIENWCRELAKFAPSLTFSVHRGPNRTGAFTGLMFTDVVITTYETMVSDITIFGSVVWSWVICDEAQAIKNPDSGRRKAVSSLTRRLSIAVTGTPVENSLEDFWSIADFAVPGILGTRQDFREDFPDSEASGRRLSTVAQLISLRRTVAQVASDLPERQDIELPLELEDELVDAYVFVRNSTLAKYPVAGGLVATLQLQLFCAHPSLSMKGGTIDGNRSSIATESLVGIETSKVSVTIRILFESFKLQRKVLVFSLFNDVADLLHNAASPNSDVFWNVINGETPQQDRQEIVDKFTAHQGPACLVLNPKAAGTGLNIVAATVVIHFTPIWNPATEAQAIARAHRRGQTLPVFVYHLYYVDTVEQVMLERSRWKREMGNEAVPVSTRDEIDLERSLKIAPQRGTTR